MNATSVPAPSPGIAAPAAYASKPSLTVVVPHHQSEHLPACLKALAGQSNRNFETVVVLDGTPSEPVIADADRPPGLRFVRTVTRDPGQPATAAPNAPGGTGSGSRGLGFTAAANVGLAQVKTPFVLLINDDVFMDTAFVDEGLKVLERRVDAAAVAGVLLQERRPERIDNLGIAYEPPGHAIRIGHNRPAAELLSDGFQPWLYGPSGAAGLYRIETLRAVAWPGGGVRSNGPGIFDERLEAYYDDIDLVLRLIHAHAATWFCSRMVARHVGHATYGRLSATLVRLSARNSRLVYNTFIPPPQRLIGLPYRLPFTAAQGMLRLFQGRGMAFLRGKLDPDYHGILQARQNEWRVLAERLRTRQGAAPVAAGAGPDATEPGA